MYYLQMFPHLELRLYLPEFPPCEDLYVGAHLLPSPRLPCPQLDVAGYQLVAAVHLSLVGEDDLPAAARRVDGQRLLEALLYIGGPDTLGVLPLGLLVVVELTAVVLGDLLVDGLRHAGQPHCVGALQTDNMFIFCLNVLQSLLLKDKLIITYICEGDFNRILEQTLQEQTAVERTLTVKKRKNGTKKTVTERNVAERSVTERKVAEWTVMERIVDARTVTERTIAEREVVEQTVMERIVVEQTEAERIAAERI